MDERQWKTKRERQAAKAENEQAAKEMAGDFDPMARIRDLEAEVERLKERHRQAIHEQALSWQASLTVLANRAEAADAKLARLVDGLEVRAAQWRHHTRGHYTREDCAAEAKELLKSATLHGESEGE